METLQNFSGVVNRSHHTVRFTLPFSTSMSDMEILRQQWTLITSDNMEKEQLLEFKLFEDEALARLHTGANRKGYLSQFRAIALPSFEDCRAYEILLPTSNSVLAIAVRTIWRRSIDIEKFVDPVVRLKTGICPLQPTIEEAQIGIRLEPVTKLLSTADIVTVPAHITNPGVGLDGTSYELVLGGHFVEARFKWWSKAPRGWEPLSELFGEIEALVETTVVAGT
jgi:hypothetical protein